MRIFKYIAFLFFLTLVFSCTKPEDDSPQSIVPSSVTDAPFRDFDNGVQDALPEDGKEPTPLFINDDGDDESGPSDGRNPK